MKMKINHEMMMHQITDCILDDDMNGVRIHILLSPIGTIILIVAKK